jgi:hypothetical protein
MALLTVVPAGGYDVILANFTKGCQGLLSPECLDRLGADACVQAAIDAVRNKGQTQGGGTNTGTLVGAAVAGE